MYDMILANCDTDSISVCKPDGAAFSDQEQNDLLNELNNLFPKQIHWESEGIFETVIVLKAKNYILWDGKKIKIKGSALKDAKKEAALKEFLFKVIESIIHNKNHYKEIYESYIKEAMDIKEIQRWSSKKTISSKVLTSTRANETKIKDAIVGTEIQEGDKIFVFFDENDNLKLVNNFNGNYNKERILEKIYKTSLIFKEVLNQEVFINYKLKKNKEKLNEILSK